VKEKFDFIIHCAHEFGSAGANPIAWNTKLIRLAESFGCRHIIYFSSLGVYANFGRESVQEDSLTLSQNDYTNFKLQSEQLILEFDWESSAIIRLGAPIGVGIPKWRLIGKLIRAASSNQTLELYKWGNRLQQYVDVRDIASVLVHVMSKGLDLQIFNLTGSELISNLDLAKKIRNTLKSNSQIVFSDNYDNQDEMRFEASCLALQQTGYNFKFSLADSISWMAANVDSKP
jgi:nucleoside-diphosphate-sugar epimerase